MTVKDIENATAHSPPRKQLTRSMTGTSLPDASIPIKKLIYALLAISLGTVIECESLVARAPGAAGRARATELRTHTPDTTTNRRCPAGRPPFVPCRV